MATSYRMRAVAIGQVANVKKTWRGATEFVKAHGANAQIQQRDREMLQKQFDGWLREIERVTGIKPETPKMRVYADVEVTTVTTRSNSRFDSEYTPGA